MMTRTTNSFDFLLLLVCFVLQITFSSSSLPIDANGYIVYCPCMGRFGNQAEQFLGSLSFAKALNRTFVIPPWVEYEPYVEGSLRVSFDTYFQVEPLKQFHRVITMEQFMDKLAPKIWPPSKRISFCYMSRASKGSNCNAKEGNPFGPFWDHFNVDFVGSEFHSPLSFDISSSGETKMWKQRYPSSKFPVLAFVGAPGPFPAHQNSLGLQQYIRWSDKIENEAKDFIQNKLQNLPFIGIHLRNGVDWKSACSHARSSPQMFASAQCTGYRNEHGRLTEEVCYPPDNTVIRQVKDTVKRLNIKAVFVATDDRDLIREMSKVMKKVKFVRAFPSNPHLDLAILSKADHYIGNCVSTFSAFAKRYRDTLGKSSSFWAFENNSRHLEL